MSETRLCENPDALMSYLYAEGDVEERRAFEAHLQACAACARDVREFKAVRTGLSQWVPPDTVLDFRIVRDDRPRRWWSRLSVPVLPVWAQLGAAAMMVGVAVGISGLEVNYGNQGLTVRTGWQRTATTPAASAPSAMAAEAVGSAPSANAPWRAELAALEQQLRSELRQPASGAAMVPAASRAPMSDQEFMNRVRDLIDASETRQQRELALRLAEVTREMETQRRADLVRVADGFGLVEGRTGAAVAQQREMLNYLMRVSNTRDPR